jgi:hypothetical protein
MTLSTLAVSFKSLMLSFVKLNNIILSVLMLSVKMQYKGLIGHSHYAEFYCTESGILFIVMLNVTMLNIVILHATFK